MPWTETAHHGYRRTRPRYASDLTDREWALIAPFMPPPKRSGRLGTTDLREVVNAILYIGPTGCRWAMLPTDLPPYSTVQRDVHDWRDSGLLHRIRFDLAMQTREMEGREAPPTAGVIDSRTVKTTESGGVRGDDAGKRITGASVTRSSTPSACSSAASSMPPTSRTATARRPCSPRSADPAPWLRHVFADGGYAGPKLRRVLGSARGRSRS